jgi:hypothetical protein
MGSLQNLALWVLVFVIPVALGTLDDPDVEAPLDA